MENEIQLINSGESVNRFNTHYEGNVNFSFDDLVRFFGIPHTTSHKCLAEWILEFKKGNHQFPITIYDWEISWKYKGDEEGLELSEIDEWHIGANNKEDCHLFYEYLNQVTDKIRKNRITALKEKIIEVEKELQEWKDNLAKTEAGEPFKVW